jgi:hypothetical protein
MRVVILAVAAIASMSDGLAREPYQGLLAIPASAGEPMMLNATVAYTSDGYTLRECRVVLSSGNQIADEQACKTVSYQNTKKPIEAITQVWKSPLVIGDFVPPVPKNNPASWLTFQDSLRDQGTYTVRLNIDAQGTVLSCGRAIPNISSSMDRLAKKTICKRAKFYPAMLDGKHVDAILLTSMRIYQGY